MQPRGRSWDEAFANRLLTAGVLDHPTLARCLAEVDGLRRQGVAVDLASFLVGRRLVDPQTLAQLDLSQRRHLGSVTRDSDRIPGTPPA